jgi:uncharacterized metal-binding protein
MTQTIPAHRGKVSKKAVVPIVILVILTFDEIVFFVVVEVVVVVMALGVFNTNFLDGIIIVE